MKKILITGGPVHANLDAVKIITNKFKGGLMKIFAENMVKTDNGVNVTYLTSKGSNIPLSYGSKLDVVYHEGFEDYRSKVAEFAPKHDAVILGAAVANLIPVNPWRGKFPSHNYNPGDIIPIDFTIAPRVIDEVKKVAPNTMLFGFKLLSGVTRNELIEAAWDIVLKSRCAAVIANDATDLNNKFVVTKERGIHPITLDNLHEFILKMIEDRYWHSQSANGLNPVSNLEFETIKKIINHWNNVPDFFPKHGELQFGTVAMRDSDNSFVTTTRGKKELEDFTRFYAVDNVVFYGSEKKASLNAPLLAKILDSNPNVHHVVHGHVQWPGLPVQPYAPPGTVRDTERSVLRSFNIEGHGCFLLCNKQMEIIR